MPSTPARRPTLPLIAGVLLLCLALLGGCAALPPRGQTDTSQALPDDGQTMLARVAAASLQADARGRSGFRLLPTGEFAFGARLALARHAERSVDVQVYHLHHDQAGRALLRELRDAAARGVRVRLLVDDFHAAEVAPLLADLASHRGVQVRLFNPLPLRQGAPLLRLMLSAGAFAHHNHRMHNKLMLADGALALYGGRNVADEYFMGNQETNFIDLDVLSAGAVVPTLAAVFDRYWNSEAAWPMQALLPQTADAVAAQARFQAAVADAAPAMPAYTLDPLGQTAVEVQLQAGRLALVSATARVFADPPEKALQDHIGGAPTAAMAGLLGVIGSARQEVLIVSPYFVPGTVGMPMMAAAARASVRTRLLTNSLATTDEPLVHHHYSLYRPAMLRLGVQILELSPEAVQRSRSFGAFGRSTPRLHAKVALVDDRHLLVGSVNLDARSAIGNTELGVAIDSPVLAGQFIRLMTGEREGGAYRVVLQDDGQTLAWQWLDAQGRRTSTTDEPGGSAWLRLKLWLQALVVDERLL
jgi:putative cardiolipin synthase